MAPFDIFRSEADGNLLWQGTSETLEGARAQARELAIGNPGEYVIMTLQTKKRYPIDANGGSNEETGGGASTLQSRAST
jgi:hypothetical protein